MPPRPRISRLLLDAFNRYHLPHFRRAYDIDLKIEGAADRYSNLRIRFRQYQQKLSDLLDIYALLELLFPETQTPELLDNPQRFRNKANAQAQGLEKIICIHALDTLYFYLSRHLEYLETVEQFV